MQKTLFYQLNLLSTLIDKKKIVLLLCSSIIISMLETIGISAIMLFISLATNPNALVYHKHLVWFTLLLNGYEINHIISIMGCCLIIFYMIRMALIGLHTYMLSSFASLQQQRLINRMFATYLNLSYQDHAQFTSTSISQLIFTYSGNITQVIHGILAVTTEIFTLSCIYSMLLYVNITMTLLLSIILFGISIIVTRCVGTVISQAGKESKDAMFTAIKLHTESFWNFKFLKLLSHHHDVLLNRMQVTTGKLVHANTTNTVWQSMPRSIIETIGFIIMIATVIIVISMQHKGSVIIPMLSIYALSFYRFLPSLNKLIAGYHMILFNNHAIAPVHAFLQNHGEPYGTQKLSFNHHIKIINVSFSYDRITPVLNNTDCTILKGERIGFIGSSGAGKSTLLDLLMGLLPPTTGCIQIDGTPLSSKNITAWRKKIGYIPQSIFLFNGTVADNIVSGRAYDEQNIITTLQQANLYDFFSTQEGIHTKISENGSNLSGGQKQRMAIARALYGNPEILVLDEATSALDITTEEKIMQTIYTLGGSTTTLIITHRTSTLAKCDRIYRVDNHTITEVATAHHLLQNVNGTLTL